MVRPAQFWNSASMALESLTAYRFRSSLALLGIVCGVAAVVAVTSIVEGLNRQVAAQVGGLGAETFFVTRTPQGLLGTVPQELRMRRPLEPVAAEVVRANPSVRDAVAYASRDLFSGHVNYAHYAGMEIDEVSLRGADEHFVQTLPGLSISRGREFTAYDVDRLRPVAMIGREIAAKLFGELDPLGRSIRVNDYPYEVVGVFDPDEGLWGAPGGDQYICIPSTLFDVRYPQLRERTLAIAAVSPRLLARAVEETVVSLRRLRSVAPGAKNDFELTRPEQTLEMWSELSGAVFAFLLILAGTSLFVSGIGIMNLMIVSVQERTWEIGLRRAVGARSSEIRLQFLTEAGLISLIGGVIGVALGAGASTLVASAFPELKPHWSLGWTLASLVTALAVGVFFGLYPATKASLVAPADSLRT